MFKLGTFYCACKLTLKLVGPVCSLSYMFGLDQTRMQMGSLLMSVSQDLFICTMGSTFTLLLQIEVFEVKL